MSPRSLAIGVAWAALTLASGAHLRVARDGPDAPSGLTAPSCQEADVSVTLEPGDCASCLVQRTGMFKLPTSTEDADLPCKFGDYSFEHGAVQFGCENGEWQLKDNTCTNCADHGCAATSYALSFSDMRGVFSLPCGPGAAKETRYCSTFSSLAGLGGWWLTEKKARVMIGLNGTTAELATPYSTFHGILMGLSIAWQGEMHGITSTMEGTEHLRFNNGSYWVRDVAQAPYDWGGNVSFTCVPGVGWKYEDQECHSVGRGCLATEYTVQAGENTEVFAISAGIQDAKKTYPCKIGNKTYSQGSVDFACHDGEWNMSSYTCGDCPSDGGCPYTNFSLTMCDDTGVFNLDCAVVGGVQEFPCKFGNHNLGSGAISFLCSDNSWMFQSQTCNTDFNDKTF